MNRKTSVFIVKFEFELHIISSAQPVFTCTNLTIETLKHENRETSISIVTFEQVNDCWTEDIISKSIYIFLKGAFS